LLVVSLSGPAIFFYLCRRHRANLVRMLAYMIACLFSSFSVPALYPSFFDYSHRYGEVGWEFVREPQPCVLNVAI